MLRGIYTAGAGMGVEQAQMDTLANNLINVATNGYKKDRVVQMPFPQLLLVQRQQETVPGVSAGWEYTGRTNQGAAVRRVETNFAPGLVQETKEPTHLALLNQNCFFAINAPAPDDPARELYTRDGEFSLDGEGYLVTARGERVLGENGPIFLGEERDFFISEEGIVSTPRQGEIDRLRLVEFADLTVLSKTGDNCFAAPPGAAVPAPNPRVRQGFLERSNVNVTAEMVNVITALRAYEANSRVLQAHNDLLGLAVNQVGALK
ncbi:MAG: flagellar hook-basal body protein [Armatimonadetes bacterium]|nr:flagellar hook-basal body protein [Armatimonadota bacterium]